MAAIHDPNGDLDLTELAKGIKEQLPSFARYTFMKLNFPSSLERSLGNDMAPK